MKNFCLNSKWFESCCRTKSLFTLFLIGSYIHSPVSRIGKSQSYCISSHKAKRGQQRTFSIVEEKGTWSSKIVKGGTMGVTVIFRLIYLDCSHEQGDISPDPWQRKWEIQRKIETDAESEIKEKVVEKWEGATQATLLLCIY